MKWWQSLNIINGEILILRYVLLGSYIKIKDKQSDLQFRCNICIVYVILLIENIINKINKPQWCHNHGLDTMSNLEHSTLLLLSSSRLKMGLILGLLVREKMKLGSLWSMELLMFFMRRFNSLKVMKVMRYFIQGLWIKSRKGSWLKGIGDSKKDNNKEISQYGNNEMIQSWISIIHTRISYFESWL